MACQGLLVGSLHWCSGGWSWISSPWSAKKCLVLSFEVCGFGVTLGSLYIKAQGYVPALLENLHGMSCSETCWLLGGAWFQCRHRGFWMSSYRLIFPGVRIFLVFSGFEFKPPSSGFLILTVVSKLLHPYSTAFKNNGLPFWVPGVLCQRSEIVLWNLLSVQMFFR